MFGDSWDPEQIAWIRANPRLSYGAFVEMFGYGRTAQAFYQRKHRVFAEVGGGPAPRPMDDTPAPATQTIKDDATEEEWEEFFGLLESADGMRHHLSTTQEETVFTAPDDGLPIAVAFTGDWHCGASGVDYARLKADLETVRDTDGLYAIGMGDYLEGVSIHSKAAPALYSGLFNDGRFQERYVVGRAALAKGKWLALLSGNHDEWLYKNAGITRTDQFATALACPYFGEGGGTVACRLGGRVYRLGVRHNAPGNSRLNTTNAQRRLFDDWPAGENCHVLCVGHFHFNDCQTVSRKGGRVVYLRNGTYKLHDQYAKAGGFSPEYGVPLVILLPDEERVIPWRGDDFEWGVDYFKALRAGYARRRAA